ncbi:MAG: LemA-like protein [Candidatus Gottesmanbacteria bacterium GW2011_GWB1_43_11]|uniref:LemA-like protein n=1 Tax=Candidatus Gottesmanbacteria bacterium GW2011_GWB1_43_11 TaxID=1618446 RepID=A0A0G1CLM3_9BACT|nr:MAG: LemA-like protein [Candidatus Gottesmanbacteria bacterium GW2011_GWB1_43_11]
MSPLLIVLGIVVLLVLFVWGLYNSLVTLRVRIKEAMSQIDVQLKRRADLIPIKGYAKHEKGVFEEVTKARSALMGAGSAHEKAVADNMLTGALKSLFAVAEAYPNLRASENFQQLQKELSDTEDKVAYSRQFYNNVVMEYNTKIMMFPNSLIAGQFGFKSEEFFAATEDERKKVEVKF